MQIFQLNERHLSQLISLLRPAVDPKDHDDFERAVQEWLKQPTKPLESTLRERGFFGETKPASAIASAITAPLDSVRADEGRDQKSSSQPALTDLTVDERSTLVTGAFTSQSKVSVQAGSQKTPQFELTNDSDDSDYVPRQTQPSRGGTPEPVRSDMQATIASVSIGGEGTAVDATTQRLSVMNRVRFEYVRPLDKGGLGIVDVARDRELGREVALKRIRPDKASTPLYRSKFIREAEVTGNLEHPGIVPVYGLGLDEHGQPYYAMRLIRGRTLAQRIRKFFSEEGKQPKPFQTAEFLRLIDHFLTVCQTIAFAHDRGVLHRDLKPVNVMVGKYGETFVVDWGLAKNVSDPFDTMEQVSPTPSGFVDESQHATRYGTALGTPAYAPPEQVLGRLEAIDSRSDVYGLGAILFEMLTGEPPVTGKNLTELIHRAGNGEVRQVKQLQSEAPKGLAAICHRCLQMDAKDRYQKVSELIDDVERWKADLPVSVLPESWLTRTYRWMRRHRGVTIASGIGLVTVALVASMASAVIFQQKEQVAQLAQDEQVARKSAETVKDFLIDAFGRFDPLRNGRDITAFEALELAGDKVDHDLAEQPEIQVEMNLAIGKSLLGMRLPDEASRRIEAAAATAEKLSGPDSSRSIRAQQLWGIALRDQGKLGESVDKLRQALKRSETTLGVSHAQTLELMMDLGDSLRRAGKYENAISLFRQVYDQRRHSLGVSAPETLVALHGLANSLSEFGKWQDAEREFKSAYEYRNERFGIDNIDTLASLAGYAECLLRAGRASEAVSAYETVLEGRTKLLPADHPMRLASLSDLADALRKSGNDQGHRAIKLLEEAYESYKSRLGSEHPETLAVAGNLAEAYEASGDLPKSIPLLVATLKGKEQKYSPDHPEVLSVKQTLAYALQTEGNFTEAEKLYDEVVKVRTERFGAEHIDTLTAMAGHADALSALNRFSEAQKLLESVLASQQKTLPTNHPDVGRTEVRLAAVLRMQRAFDKADETYATAIKQLEKSLDENHPDLLAAKHQQSLNWLAIGRNQDALRSLTELHRRFVDQLGTNNPDTLSVAAALGNAYLRTDQLQPLFELLEPTVDQMNKVLKDTHPDRISAIVTLAAAYRKAELFEDFDKELAPILKLQQNGNANMQLDGVQTALSLAEVRLKNGRVKEAIDVASIAAQLASANVGESNTLTREALGMLVEAYLKANSLADAEKVLKRMIESCAKDPDATIESLFAQDQLLKVLRKEGKIEEASTLVRTLAVKSVEMIQAKQEGSLEAAAGIAESAVMLEQFAEAKPLLQAVTSESESQGLEERHRWKPLLLYGELLLHDKDFDQAVVVLQETADITGRIAPGTWFWSWANVRLAKGLIGRNDKEKAREILQFAAPALQSQLSQLPDELKTLPEEAAALLKEVN